MLYLFIARCVRSAALMALCICAALFFHAGCGGNTSDTNFDESINVGSVEDLIFGDSYAGYLAVHLEEGMEARFEDDSKSLYSKSGDARIDSVREVLDGFPELQLKRSVEMTSEKVDEVRAHLEKLSGKNLLDWNSVYYIAVEEPAEALELYNELRGTDGIQNVYPKLIPKMQSLNTTPSLESLQGYLYSEATHGGLNAQAAWNVGANGNGVYVVFNESGINLDHEDLGLSKTYYQQGGSMFYDPDCAPGIPPAIIGDCQAHIAHGTAGAGVVVGQDNSHGVTGMAPDAHYLNAHLRSTIPGIIVPSTDGIDTGSHVDDDIEAGSIWVLPVAEDLQGGFNGNAPVTVMADVFAAVEQASAYGVTVVLGAGNGDVDLDNQSLYSSYPFLIDITQNDSSGILVGASWGTGNNKDRADFSNCGSPVDMFAWGSGVVTTGYQYGEYAWEGGMVITPPNTDVNAFFVNNHGGTSAATAMVAGAAVSIQSHFKNTANMKSYLMPSKIKEFLIDSGVTQGDAGCNIGKQPRIDVAIGYVNQFVATTLPLHPKFVSGDIMSEQEMLALR
ncbi:MAG: S8 family serine peptidase, partial [Deltaproteobacteria bacterium]|nr:S8 family serine peptidase [Deltaproteobacteria bacterium]